LVLSARPSERLSSLAAELKAIAVPGDIISPQTPPRRGARIWRHGNANDPPLARDESLRSIRRTGRGVWKRAIGYHRRNKAKTAIFRIKTIFGDRVRSRSFEAQAAEMLIRCSALNRMTHLGMPYSYAV
jgi:hypothetical protein